MTIAPSGEDAITRTLDVKQDNEAERLTQEQFDDFYEIGRTADEIIKGDYKRIALQFPDHLLHDSVPIFRRLKSRIGQGRELYVLADTSYGSCCVDEVAAQHVDADAMVHYGHACMSLTSRLPVIYVFGKKHLDVDDCSRRLLEFYDAHAAKNQKAILLKHDVVYTHLAETVREKLKSALEPRQIPVLYHAIQTISAPVTGAPVPTDKSAEDVPLEYTTIFYIGAESLALTNILMTNSSCDVISYNPTTRTTRLESASTNKLLMRRYALVQKARDADVVGILVGTLGVASYLPLITHLRTLLSKHRKKSYTISVGKLNPAKLANFLEIECFVLVACSENSVVEAREFLRPIITPFELGMALQAERSWTGRYVLDFGRVIEESKEVEEGEEEEGEEDEPVFSLVTGTYRHAKKYGGATKEIKGEGDAVALRNQESAVALLEDSAAGVFLRGRSYQGLEIDGETGPSVLEQGRSGIARGYQDDH